MKKVVLVIFIFLIAFFVNGEKMENSPNKLDNEVVSQNEIASIVIENKTIEVVNQQKLLDGKTIAFIGDSLIRGYGNEDRGFDYYLAQSLPNTNFINNSKSGSTITDNSGSDNIIMINQAKTLAGNPDIIVFDGGANDIIGYALGFLNNDLKKEIGTVNMDKTALPSEETVISDLEEVIMHLKNTYPNAKFCYFQSFLLDDETISHLTAEEAQKQEIIARKDSFYTELQKLCIKWDIEYLDVSNNFAGTGTSYRHDDWIHIKEEGYKLLTPYLLNKLKEM